MLESSFFPAATFLKVMFRATLTFTMIIIGLPGVTETVVVFTVPVFKTARPFKSSFPVAGIPLSSGMTVGMAGSTEGF